MTRRQPITAADLMDAAEVTATYRLPAKFYNDHVFRELPAGKVLKQNDRYVTVELDREAYDDLLSDADYYDDAEMWENHRGLAMSARATFKTLTKIGPPS
jgi:hypothetical protein